jgi:casein kinase 1 epsilon
MENQVIAGRFLLLRKIGAGSFGQIFECTHLRSGRKYAAKIEPESTRAPQLAYETTIYHTLSSSVNVPRLYWYGTDRSNRIAIVDLLGNSLEQIHIAHNQLSLKTVLMLYGQMLSAVKFLHRKH